MTRWGFGKNKEIKRIINKGEQKKRCGVEKKWVQKRESEKENKDN